MREITSKDNRIYKTCEQLSLKKYRDKLGRYLIEGENLIEEALKTGCSIETLLVRRGYNKVPAELEDKAFVLDEKLFDRLAQTETSQGVLAIVAKPETYAGDFAVVMKGTADIFSPKVVRAATGSLFRMPVVFMDSNSELVEFTRAAGKKLVATCFDTERCYFDEDLTDNIALVIGNEGNGICKEIIESSDVKIKIPMHGNIESLNASVAAGILMYEAVRGKKG